MSIIKSDYKPLFFLKNPHIQTMYPLFIRKKEKINYQRERLLTEDDDFIDIDWSKTGSKKLALIIHGMESNSYGKNILSLVKAFNKRDWDCVCINLRGCSGEPNMQSYFYHSGATNDIDTVIKYIVRQKRYDEISLIGFSLGGNIVLKYLGEKKSEIPSVIKKAAAASVPCSLNTCHDKIEKYKVYKNHFLKRLIKKVRIKSKEYPDKISTVNLKYVKSIKTFDDYYTAPLNGFKNAEDYYIKSSSLPFLSEIKIPTLILNAIDDPFLDKNCFPIEEVRKNKFLYLEISEYGGHLGFVLFNKDNEHYHDKKITSFITKTDNEEFDLEIADN